MTSKFKIQKEKEQVLRQNTERERIGFTKVAPFKAKDTETRKTKTQNDENLILPKEQVKKCRL